MIIDLDHKSIEQLNDLYTISIIYNYNTYSLRDLLEDFLESKRELDQLREDVRSIHNKGEILECRLANIEINLPPQKKLLK